MFNQSTLDEFKVVVKVAAIAFIAFFCYTTVADFFSPKPDLTKVAVESAPAVAVRSLPRVAVEMKATVKAYKPEAKAKLRLPDAVINDADKQVVSATTIRQSERQQTVSTVIDTQTGESKTYVKEEPFPWFAVESRGEARIDYGYKLALRRSALMEPVARLTIRHDVVQVKGFHLGVNATLDSDREYFAGFGIGYRW